MNPKWYPTRFLDIGGPEDLTWKLHIFGEDTLMFPNYMTLSYRWEDLPGLKLKQSNIDELRRARLIDELPQTFQDAMNVARGFSIRYLWIGRLCIIQDSEEDWEKESSTMRHVYANSSCNISATASSDPSDGLFCHRNKDVVLPGLVLLATGSVRCKHQIGYADYWDRYVSDTVLNRRA